MLNFCSILSMYCSFTRLATNCSSKPSSKSVCPFYAVSDNDVLLCVIQNKMLSVNICKRTDLPLNMYLTLTFQGHPRSNLTVPLNSPYMISYWLLAVIYDITWLLYKINVSKSERLDIFLSMALKVKCAGTIIVTTCLSQSGPLMD